MIWHFLQESLRPASIRVRVGTVFRAYCNLDFLWADILSGKVLLDVAGYGKDLLYFVRLVLPGWLGRVMYFWVAVFHVKHFLEKYIFFWHF